MKKSFLIIVSIILFSNLKYFPQTYYYGIDLDTVKAQKFDMGKMWTFENPPLDYFEATYGFRPDQEWLDKVQKSALKFGSGCSASFISENGLIMTNHHCIRSILRDMSTDERDLLKYKFYAERLEDELKIPNLSVSQLMMIEDVTDEIQSAMNSVDTDSEKVAKRDQTIDEIKERYLKINPDLEFKVVSLYYGGKYSLYGYKKYNDIRLVFAPELMVSKLGGDYDNFTYPRYGLDCAFLRAYENDKPAKTDFHFKWTMQPIYEDQPVFVVGNPGSTNRLYTIAQLVYLRDFVYGLQTPMRQALYNIYENLVEETNAEDMKLVVTLFNVGNGLKVYKATYEALQDPYFIARKKDFEEKFKLAVQSNPELNEKYGNIWSEIAANRKEASGYVKELFALTVNPSFSPKYLIIAEQLVKLAENKEKLKTLNADSLADKYFPADFNPKLEEQKLLIQVNVWKNNLPADEISINQEGYNGISEKETVEYYLINSKLKSKEDVVKLTKSGSEGILNSDDPFIKFVLNSNKRLKELQLKNRKLDEEDEINNQLLGKAFYHIHGDSIPPDATGTLRISDGIVKGYDYNGTRAPIKTTFYGSLDRYYSFDKKFPFNLPAYWENLPEDFDLSTPLDFINTCDIIGGNSGSPVINTNAEIVGLAFDGNMESHSGKFIYTTEKNRTVCVTAEGMIEAVRYIYKAERLANEILNGNID
jgi:hypothetical protein